MNFASTVQNGCHEGLVTQLASILPAEGRLSNDAASIILHENERRVAAGFVRHLTPNSSVFPCCSSPTASSIFLFRICIIVSRIRVVFSIGALHGGGSERQIVSALTHLDRQRFEPHLYVIYRDGPLLPMLPDDVPVAAYEERDRRLATRIPGAMHRRRVADMSRYLQEIDADVCYDRTFLMTLVAAEAAQQVQVPNVSTIVTDPSTGFAPVAGRFQWFKKRSLRRLYEHSTAVLAVSSGAARSAERFYQLTPGRVFTHYNGVDIKRIRALSESATLPDWWIAPSAAGRTLVRLVSAGRLNHEKGFHLLIDAVAQLQKKMPDREFRLALLGEGGHRDALQQQIAAHGLTDQIRMPGFQDAAPAWYCTADVYVLSSLVEGMPNTVLEAMACETPVVASRCPHGPEEILEGGRCGVLCEVNSTVGLEDGVAKLVADTDLAKQLAKLALVRIESDFSQPVSQLRLETALVNAAHP